MSHAGDIPIIGIDPLYWDQVGWSWGAANDPNSVTASPNVIVLDIDISDTSDWPGTTNGGIGVDTGEILVDFDAYQLDVQLRVLADNFAPLFRITIGEIGSPATGEEYQYIHDLADLDVDEWTNFSTPLSEWDSVFTTGGDNVPESPLRYINMQTMWGATSPLNIEIAKSSSIQSTPVPMESYLS